MHQDLVAIAGGPVSTDNPTIPKLYAPASTPGGSPCEPLPPQLEAYESNLQIKLPSSDGVLQG